MFKAGEPEAAGPGLACACTGGRGAAGPGDAGGAGDGFEKSLTPVGIGCRGPERI
jgi:hypothetical protein